jgi:hypothetical protein
MSNLQTTHWRRDACRARFHGGTRKDDKLRENAIIPLLELGMFNPKFGQLSRKP